MTDRTTKIPFHERWVRRKDYDKLRDHWFKVWQENIRLRARLHRLKESK